jgi:hypothetical protein
MLTRHLRQALQSPLPLLASGLRHWRRHGARIRRARVLCQCGDGLRLRRWPAWEERARRLYRRSTGTLGALAGAEPEAQLAPALAARRALHRATAPYREFLVGLIQAAALLAAALLLVLGTASAVSPRVRGRLFPRDLAAGQPWVASSSHEGLPVSSIDPRSAGPMFFHTQASNNPNVEIDLGADHVIRGVLVENRADCCQERALPLNVEVWKDGAWQLIAQRRTAFTTWAYDVAPVRARRIRFLRPGVSFLHLKRISVFGQ